MLVVYSGHSKVLMADFNGKRYCFEKGKPIDIPQQVYDYIILSEHVDAIDLRIVIPEVKEKIKEEEPAPEEKKEKQRGRPKGRK